VHRGEAHEMTRLSAHLKKYVEAVLSLKLARPRCASKRGERRHDAAPLRTSLQRSDGSANARSVCRRRAGVLGGAGDS
jgi:hypothetical protein